MITERNVFFSWTNANFVETRKLFTHLAAESLANKSGQLNQFDNQILGKTNFARCSAHCVETLSPVPTICVFISSAEQITVTKRTTSAMFPFKPLLHICIAEFRQLCEPENCKLNVKQIESRICLFTQHKLKLTQTERPCRDDRDLLWVSFKNASKKGARRCNLLY